MKIKVSEQAKYLIEEFGDAVAALGSKKARSSEKQRDEAYFKARKELYDFVAALEKAEHYPRIASQTSDVAEVPR